MTREIDLRNQSINRITSTRNNELIRAAREVSDMLAGEHTLSIESFDVATGNANLINSESAPAEKGNYVQRALNFVQEISPVLGFAPTQAPDFVPDPQIQTLSSGAVTVNLQQQYKGIRIFQAARTVRFNPDGALAESSGNNITISDELQVAPKLKPQEAVLKAAQFVSTPQPDEEQVDEFGEQIPFAYVDITNYTPQIIATFTDSPRMSTVLTAGPFAEEIRANLIWFPLDDKLLLAWEVLLTMPGFQEQYRTLVDAENGQILYCKQTVDTIMARGKVFLRDGAGEREVVSFPRDLQDFGILLPNDLPETFPDFWVTGQELSGGNAVTLELNGNPTIIQGVENNGVLTFDLTDPTSDEQRLLNLFYYVNYIHDFFYLYGFREADGNFQTDNLGRGGGASDPVKAIVHSQPVFGTANMITRVDGISPTMNMGLVSKTNLHTALDSSVVFHEFTHGVTNRLVGGAMNVHALDEAQSRGMGEGWGDYIACSINQTETVGNWVTGKPGGIRLFPYNEDFPDDFGKIGTGRYLGPHAIGEIWCATLLSMNRRIGQHLGIQLVIDALKLSPANPSFLDMRDSILTALENKRLAGQINPADFENAQIGIWEVFAKFGMGVNAQSNGATLSGIVPDYTVPDSLDTTDTDSINPTTEDSMGNVSFGNSLLGETAIQLADAAGWDLKRRESFADVLAAIRVHGEELIKLSNVVSVRPGFRFNNGKITNEPCITVSVLRKLDLTNISATQIIPQKLGKVLVDVVPATPLEQILYREKQSMAGFSDTMSGKITTTLPGEADFLESSTSAASLIPYRPPTDTKLKEVNKQMTIICHVSPDAGWRNLDTFLSETTQRLTATMYEFNAGYIFNRLLDTFSQSKELNLILDGGASATVPSPTQGDLSKDLIRRRLDQKLGNRFNFCWAAVADDGKTTNAFFPKAYHIKVAVRDSNSFWLSSGNWKRANQPQTDPLNPPSHFNGWSFLRNKGYNREWHVIVHQKDLAETFEKYILHDIESAKPLQVSASGFTPTPAMPDLFVSEDFFTDIEALEQPQFFREKEFTGQIRVQPLLTPDLDENNKHMFIQHILSLIKNAKSKIYFQNQSLSPRFDLSEHTELFKTLSEKSRGQKPDVKIILSEYADLSLLASANFNMDRVKVQKECHNKGIIIDDEIVVIGSQNWTGQGTTQNRDASLVIHNTDIAKYFTDIFLFDWNNLATFENPLMMSMPVVAFAGEPTPPGMVRVAWNDFLPEARVGFST
jgi:extracellular elastinolytic metalloproteinase